MTTGTGTIGPGSAVAGPLSGAAGPLSGVAGPLSGVIRTATSPPLDAPPGTSRHRWPMRSTWRR